MDTMPQNLEAERFVLGSILMDASVYPAAADCLKPDDFALEKHRRIFTRMADLHARGEAIDRVTLANELVRHGELESCDGVAYLVSLDDGLPKLFNIESYMRIVKQKASLRKIVFAAQHMQNRAFAGEEDPGDILTSCEQVFRGLSEAQMSPRAHAGAQLVASVLNLAQERKEFWERTRSPFMGIETGISRLDRKLGGLAPGLHLLGGGPGVGKTTLSMQIALRACRHGCPVVYVSYENSPRNLVMKAVCADAGVSPLEIERGTAHVNDFRRFEASAAAMAESLKLLTVIEGSISLQISSIERTAKEQCERTGVGCLLIFDYLQRAAWGEKYSEVRHNVSALASKLRDTANRLGCPVLALSSQNRASGGYGNRGSAALDSLKESGDLEYSADTVIFLTPDGERCYPEKDPRVALTATIAKNRNGPLDKIALVFRPDLALFAEEQEESVAGSRL